MRKGWGNKENPNSSMQYKREIGNNSCRDSRERNVSQNSGKGTKLSMATQKKLSQKLLFNHI